MATVGSMAMIQLKMATGFRENRRKHRQSVFKEHFLIRKVHGVVQRRDGKYPERQERLL